MATQAEIEAATKALSEGGWDDPRTAAETALDAAGIERLRAENAELREALRAFWMDKLTKEEARALFDKTCPSALEQGFIPWGSV